MTTENNLTICIVCSDPKPEDRVYKFIDLLLNNKNVKEVYTLQSDKNRTKFTQENLSNLSLTKTLSKDFFPEKVTAVFLHESDTTTLWEPFWIKENRKADFVFKFNSPGDPIAEGEKLPIYRKNEGNDFGITAKDIQEAVAYITGQRIEMPSMCFPSLELSKKQEIISPEQIQKIWQRLFAQLKKYQFQKIDIYGEEICKLVGRPKPTLYIFDDYNNYIICDNGIYKPNPKLTQNEILDYYCESPTTEKEKFRLEFTKEILGGFCLMLNNLSLTFTVKAPPLWIPKRKAGHDLVAAALPINQINCDRAQIAAFIVDLEWLPTLTNYQWEEPDKNNRQDYRKMGGFAIEILSQLYPEIPSFVFTGLQAAEDLQEALSRGATWGFHKENTHHYENATNQPLSEQLTYINLEKHLTRSVNVRYSYYQEVPFTNQLKIDPSNPTTQKLLKQLDIKLPIDQSFQGTALQKLIASLLPNATLVEPIKVLITGKSKAEATFFVSPSTGQDKLATRFIKIGPWLSVQKEYLAYQSIIHPRLNSHTANLIHRPILAEGEAGEMPKGALMYSLAGLPEDYQNLQSLDELIRKHLENTQDDKILLERLQKTLENVLYILYRSETYQQKKQPLWRWLGDSLPPLYTGILIPLPQTSYEELDDPKTQKVLVLDSKTAQGYKNTAAWTLASFDLTQINIELEQQRQNCLVNKLSENPSHWVNEIDKTYKRVLLDGWHLYSVDWENGDLGNGVVTLIHPDLGIKILLRGQGEDIRRRFGATWIRPGMSVKVLACLDIDNQEQEKIKRKINENLSNLGWLNNLDKESTSNDIFDYILQKFAEVNSLSQDSLTSPFKVFGQNSILPHHYTIAAHAGVIHGDLNLNNLLYTSGDSVGWLIDFELVKEQGMIAFDLAKLEVEIWNHHLSPYLATVAKIIAGDHGNSSYQLLNWCLQALDFAGDETAFFVSKVKSEKTFSETSEDLLVPIINALKLIKAIRRFAMAKCRLTQGELKWALAGYFFNAIKFNSQNEKYKSATPCTAIFAFLASAWHLDAVLPAVD